MDKLKSLEKIIARLDQQKILTPEITESIIQIVSEKKFFSAMEKITLNQVNLFVFKPSNRQVWTVMGEEKRYLLYPKIYCSCMDFYLKGIIKKRKYICKHLLAQMIFKHIDKDKLSNVEIVLHDTEFNTLLKEIGFT
ncbi:MAG: hypothetical protein GF364_07725 [Candidatus Lokiarchaeota archaeon]|nr:hypothetical protein [Candidatus Lokiarchaeota archaeon]